MSRKKFKFAVSSPDEFLLVKVEVFVGTLVQQNLNVVTTNIYCLVCFETVILNRSTSGEVTGKKVDCRMRRAWPAER